MAINSASNVADGKKANEKWIDYFKRCKDVLFFDLVAGGVGLDVVHNTVTDSSLQSSQEKQTRLYENLEKLFDETQDDFEVAVIGSFFKTGNFFWCFTDLCDFVYKPNKVGEKVEEYKGKTGKRFKEFSDKTSAAALRLVEKLVTEEKQFEVAKGLIGVAIACAGGGKQNTEIQGKLNDWIFRLEFNEDEVLSVQKFQFMVPAINLLLDAKNKAYITSEILSKIDTMIDFAVMCGDTAKTARSKYNKMGFECIFPQAYRLKLEYYKKSNKTTEEREVALCLAETYVTFARKRVGAGTPDDLYAAFYSHYAGSIETLQEYGGSFKEQLAEVKHERDELRHKWDGLPSLSTTIDENLDVRGVISEEGRQFVQNYLAGFSQMNLSDQIKNLVSVVRLETKGSVELLRQQTRKDNPLSEVFLNVIRNARGETIWEARSEEDKENKALFDWVSLSPLLYNDLLRLIGQQISRDRTCFKNLDFTKFLEESVEITALAKRADVINRAFQLFFMGDVYSALHILIPQVEYWFREEVYTLGGQTSNLNHFSVNSPIEESKTLGAVFEDKESKESEEYLAKYLGKDIHWLFKRLMLEEPMNLRNKIAHGLDLNGDGCAVYFVLATLKLMLMKQGVLNF